MVRLKAPAHIAAVEYGGQRYVVENGHVLVPVMAEAALTLPNMGFTFPDGPRLVLRATPKTTETLHVKHGNR